MLLAPNTAPMNAPMNAQVSNQYNPFENNKSLMKQCKDYSTYITYGIFHAILTFIAVYLSWKCNDGKLDLLAFVIALFFPYIYIIFIFATRGTCDMKMS